MRRRSKTLSVATVILSVSLTVLAQAGQEHVDTVGKFRLTLFGDWRAVTYNDAVGRSRTDFVYRDRSEGLLKVSRERLGGGSLPDLVRREEQNLKIYRDGFEAAGSEPFGGGALSGIRYSFYHVEGGRRIASTFYFLQDGDAVWVLRFTGRRGSLDTIRNVTDQVARSFRALP